MKGFILFIAALLFLVTTTSVAQIRYAIENPFTSISAFINLGILMLFVLAFIYFRMSNNKNVGQGYNLMGSKGGKSSKKKFRVRNWFDLRSKKS